MTTRDPTASVHQHSWASMKRVLFVGNSLTYWNKGVDVFVANLGDFQAERIAEPGASLKRHWLNGRAAAKIRDGGWDWVVLQEDLPETSRPHFEQAARNFSEAAVAVGAQVILFMAWAYERLPTTHDEVVTAHLAMAAALGCAIAPVGVAFQIAKVSSSDVALPLLEPDEEHPSIAGTFLAALMIHAVLSGGDPAPPDGWLPAGLDMDIAEALRDIAVKALTSWKADDQSLTSSIHVDNDI